MAPSGHTTAGSRGTALSPAAHRRREAGAGVVVASGQVISMRQPSFGPPSISDREKAHRRFGVPSVSIRTNCKGMSVSINGVVRTIETDSGYSWSGWPLVRQITVTQAFPFPVEPGALFTVTARPSADLSWDQLHVFRNAQIEGQRRDNSSLFWSLAFLMLAVIGRWLFMQHTVILGSGPMQTVVGTWTVTSWMVHTWKGYSPAVVNVPDTLILRIAWQAIIGTITFVFFITGLRGISLWSLANMHDMSLRAWGTEMPGKLRCQTIEGQAEGGESRMDGTRKVNVGSKGAGRMRALASPPGNSDFSLHAASFNGISSRQPGSAIGGGWAAGSPSGHGPMSPYAPISQSMLGSPSGFAQASSPMGASTVFGSPQGRAGLLQGTPRGVHFASPVAAARTFMSPSSPRQTTSSSIFSSPIRSPMPGIPHDRSHAFGEWCEKRRTRLEESKDGTFNLRHNSPLTAAKSPFSTSINNTSNLNKASVLFSNALNTTSPQTLNTTQLGRSAAQATEHALGDSSTLVLSSSPIDRKYAWWLERPNGALIYLRELITDRGITADPQSLLSQCAHGVRSWLAITVLGQVSALMTQVDHDAARGLHNQPPATPAASGAAPAATGFGAAPTVGGFGASTFGGLGGSTGGAFGQSAFGSVAAQTQQTGQQAAQQQQKEAADKAVAQRRADSLDLRARLKDYTTMARFPEPDKGAGMGSMRVSTYIRKRIKELSEDKGLLAYVWDGGSPEYSECVMSTAEHTLYESQHHPFAPYRNSQMANSTVDASRFWPTEGRAKRVWPQHELGQSGTISTSTRALPTDAELLLHVFCTYMDQKRRPSPHPKKAPAGAKPAAAAPAAASTFGGGFGAASNPFGASTLGGGLAGAASTANAGAAAGGVALTPNLKDTKWFTSDHFLPANPSALSRRPHRGAHVQSMTDVSRNLKSKPFIEERLGHDPDCPQKMCPQLVVCLSSKRTTALHHHSAGAPEQAFLPDRAVAVEVQPGPDNVFQAIAVLAVEARVNCRGMLGNVDLSHPTLNLMSFIPNLG